MFDKELYKNTFSVLKASENTLSEVMKMTTKRKRRVSKTLLVAAIISILTVAFVGTAFATNFFGLRSLTLPTPTPDAVITFENFPGTEEEYIEINPDGTLEDFIVERNPDLFISGFIDSPEHNAAVEWREYLNSREDEVSNIRRDPETGELVNADTDEPLPNIPERYVWYGVGSQEGIDKLHEIAEKHGLVLLGEMFTYDLWETHQWEQFQANIANAHFVDDTDGSVSFFPNYRFENKSFKFEGYYNDTYFGFYSNRKGTFNPVVMSDFNITAYNDEWVYRNIHGTELLLFQSNIQSLIILDTDTAFTLISLHAGNEVLRLDDKEFMLTRSELEHFADLFDFTKLR